MPNNPEMPALAPEQGGDEIEQLLSQLSPEQLEQLAAELSGYMQSPEQAGEAGHVGDLASAIEAHLAQNPEAAAPEAIEPEKMAAFALVKSAAYIEGFLNQAVAGGANIKQAVDMYDSSLTETLMNLKQAALKGNQYKLDVDKDGKIEASDLAKLRHEKSETPKQEKKEHKNELEEIKEAAYYEGMLQRASEYGFSENDVVKVANFISDMKNSAVETYRPYAHGLVDRIGGALSSLNGGIRDEVGKTHGIVDRIGGALNSFTDPNLKDNLHHKIDMMLPATPVAGEFVDGPPMPNPLEKLQMAGASLKNNIGDAATKGMESLKGFADQGMEFAKNHIPELGGAAVGGLGALALASYLRNKNKHNDEME